MPDSGSYHHHRRKMSSEDENFDEKAQRRIIDAKVKARPGMHLNELKYEILNLILSKFNRA